MNKKGVVMFGMLILIVGSLIGIILLGLWIYTFDAITGGILEQNIMAGQVNLTNATQLTLGKLDNALLQNANLIGGAFLFGLILGLIIAAFLTRDKKPKVFWIVDFIILILFYIIAVYISNAYETILEAIPFATIFTVNMSLPSSFLLNLPLITAIVGGIVMLLSYAAIPRTQEEQVAGFG